MKISTMHVYQNARHWALGLILLTALFSSHAHADSALRDLQGNITTFSDQQVPGKWTVVMIWASDCHVCNAESGQYSGFHQAHSATDATVLGISIDGKERLEDAREFVDRNGVVYPNLIGDLDTVAQWYHMETGEDFIATPTFVVFGPEGEVRAAQPGAVPPSAIEEFISGKS